MGAGDDGKRDAKLDRNMRVVVIGGFGNFGARICRALEGNPGIEVIASSRSAGAQLDIGADGLANALRQLSPDLVIHCAGPFQGQGYGVASAALTSGAHYLDLADGREFVAEFRRHNDHAAVAADRIAISGVSTLPALSSAAIDSLQGRFRQMIEIHVVIAPGQRAPRGAATLAVVFSYAGRPFNWLQDGNWTDAWGWQELRRAGVPLPIERWAGPLDRLASWLDAFGSERGGMLVSVTGEKADGSRARIDWSLVADGNHGPEIPCMPAILLARKLARGAIALRGAHPCMGFLTLSDFEPEFLRCKMQTKLEERAA